MKTRVSRWPSQMTLKHNLDEISTRGYGVMTYEAWRHQQQLLHPKQMMNRENTGTFVYWWLAINLCTNNEGFHDVDEQTHQYKNSRTSGVHTTILRGRLGICIVTFCTFCIMTRCVDLLDQFTEWIRNWARVWEKALVATHVRDELSIWTGIRVKRRWTGIRVKRRWLYRYDYLFGWHISCFMVHGHMEMNCFRTCWRGQDLWHTMNSKSVSGELGLNLRLRQGII